MTQYIPFPGTPGFLVLCLAIWLTVVTLATYWACKSDLRSAQSRATGVSAITLVILTLLGGWLGYKVVQWLDNHRAGGRLTAWVATLAGAAQVGLVAFAAAQGMIPDMTVGEMLTYMTQGEQGVDEARLPRRFGPGS